MHVTFDTRPDGNISWSDFRGAENIRVGEVVRLNVNKFRGDGDRESLGITYVVRDRYRGQYVPDHPSGKTVRVEIVLDKKLVAVLANVLTKYVISDGCEDIPYPLIEFERFASRTGEAVVDFPLEFQL